MALAMFHLPLITKCAPSFSNSSWAGTRVSHSISRSKKVLLANTSPQLIDLSLWRKAGMSPCRFLPWMIENLMLSYIKFCLDRCVLQSEGHAERRHFCVCKRACSPPVPAGAPSTVALHGTSQPWQCESQGSEESERVLVLVHAQEAGLPRLRRIRQIHAFWLSKRKPTNFQKAVVSLRTEFGLCWWRLELFLL